MKESYALIDSGDQQKWERFGPVSIVRPCSQALWRPTLSKKEWASADASFSRENGNAWKMGHRVPKTWVVEIQGLKFKIAPTDFGHLGVFPEHSMLWKEMEELIRSRKSAPRVLNLFAYSGGATLAAARAGAEVCHLDASKGMVSWARENAALNQLEKAPIRWIIDDVSKFLKREEKRGVRYDGIIADPPSFGRGSQGEVFKIERDVHEILDLCRRVLSETPLFLIFTTHTPGMTPIVMGHLLKQLMASYGGRVETGEMVLPQENEQCLKVPCGSYAMWKSS
jgi:23S rRNA (cytosine1962-C5)-methyltransferase